jgi:hypothetical protein
LQLNKFVEKNGNLLLFISKDSALTYLPTATTAKIISSRSRIILAFSVDFGELIKKGARNVEGMNLLVRVKNVFFASIYF